MLTFAALWLALQPGCTRTENPPNSAKLEPVRLLLDQPPLTLNPRKGLDATSQRLAALLYFGLTRLDRELRVAPALAESWAVSKDGKNWVFRVAGGLRDHKGDPITAQNVRDCLESYRVGSPVSPLASSLPQWAATRAEADRVVVELSAPDPYLARNLTALRYFRTESAAPCQEPREAERIWGSGPFRARDGLSNLPPEQAFPKQEITLLPVPEAAARAGLRDPSPLSFRFVRDENTRLLWLLRGEADGVLNGFSLSKTGWLRDAHKDRFQVLEREGATVDYLAFNLRDRLLSDARVRHAIALAIDRDPVIRHKHAGYTAPAGSFLPPALAESFGEPIPYDPEKAKRLLDEAGHRPGPDGIRLRLGYKTTSAEIGIERALLFREMLRKVGIELELQVVEPAMFFASLGRGAFQLYSSRWVGASDGSIYLISLHSKQARNRVGYSSPEMDRLLERAMSEMDERKRIALLREVQLKMNQDLPYVPLWFWKNALVLDRRMRGLASSDLAINGALAPLSELRGAEGRSR